MVPNMSNKLILAAASVVAVVGVVDGTISNDWDLVIILAMILGLQLLLWGHISWGRPAVPLRADLVAWLRDRAVTGGESLERVADRAVGAYRVGLTGHEPDQDGH